MSNYIFDFVSSCCDAEVLNGTCGSCKEHCSYANPPWICSDCGNKYGNTPCGVATWHEDICGICGETAQVTEPRDFGYIDFDKLSDNKSDKAIDWFYSLTPFEQLEFREKFCEEKFAEWCVFLCRQEKE